ncbi:MAG: hypothetical protein ABIS84_03900 [Arachnia sp.]
MRPPMPVVAMDVREGEWAWGPRVTLALALMMAACLPFVHHLGAVGALPLGIAIVLLGATGFFWSVALNDRCMAAANIVVGVLAVPAALALGAWAGGP